MLTKLLKYDLKNDLKKLYIFYALPIFFALVSKIIHNIGNSFAINAISYICGFIAIILCIVLVAMNVINCWNNFIKSIYGDTSYLTHTLPVTKKQIFLSKSLSTTITLLISAIVVVLTLVLTLITKENSSKILELFTEMFGKKSAPFFMPFIIIVLIYLEVLNIIELGYFGIILGYRKQNGKGGFSFLFGYIAYIITQIILFIIFYLYYYSVGNIDILFEQQGISNLIVLRPFMLVCVTYYLILIIIDNIINIKNLNKGVNIE